MQVGDIGSSSALDGRASDPTQQIWLVSVGWDLSRIHHGSARHEPESTHAMIIWTGNGIVVPFLFAAGYWIASLTANGIWGANYTETHDWVISVSIVIGSVFCWLVGRSLQKRAARVVIDKQTGKEFIYRTSHTLMLIPIHWYAIIGLAAALYVGIHGVPRSP